MKRLIAVLLLSFALPVYAAGITSGQVDQAGWKNLSETEKAAIIQQVADQAAKNKASGIVAVNADPSKVTQWVDIGERIGKMIGGVAKEVGVAVNEFVKTPVGMMAMALVVWHYMGGVLVHLVGGLLVLTVGFSFLLYVMRRSVTVTREYDASKTNIFGNSRLVRVSRTELDDSDKVGYLITAAIIIVVSLITTFTF